jgi:hypothetical protein
MSVSKLKAILQSETDHRRPTSLDPRPPPTIRRSTILPSPMLNLYDAQTTRLSCLPFGRVRHPLLVPLRNGLGRRGEQLRTALLCRNRNKHGRRILAKRRSARTNPPRSVRGWSRRLKLGNLATILALWHGDRSEPPAIATPIPTRLLFPRLRLALTLDCTNGMHDVTSSAQPRQIEYS